MSNGDVFSFRLAPGWSENWTEFRRVWPRKPILRVARYPPGGSQDCKRENLSRRCAIREEPWRTPVYQLLDTLRQCEETVPK